MNRVIMEIFMKIEQNCYKNNRNKRTDGGKDNLNNG